MKPLHLLVIGAAMSASLIFAAARADARPRPGGGRPEIPLPPPPIDRVHGIGGVIVVEREVVRVVEREVVREAPPPPPAEPPPPPRKPYVIGSSYDTLPGGCMKLIDTGVSYYHCSGEWYRAVRSGSDVQYQAVRQP